MDSSCASSPDRSEGAGFSYVPADGSEDPEEEDHVVDSTHLRLMWDHGMGPLWARGEGLLPDDPAWLQRALGLSDALVADLLAWLSDRDRVEHALVSTGVDLRQESDARAETLVARLQQEVGSRFQVVYRR